MKRKAHPHEHQGELNIVPYLDIVVNLVMFMLMSMTGFITFQMINVTTPDLADSTTASSTPPPQDKEEEALVLNVSISTKGFFIAASGGVLGAAEGADKADPNTAPPTIPLKDGKYDYEALALKMASIKEDKAWKDKTQYFLAADKTISYDVIVQTMDAARGDSQKTLFPDVAFAAIGD